MFSTNNINSHFTWLFPIAVLLFIGCDNKPSKKTIVLRGQAMGTSWQVKLVRLPDSTSETQLKQEIEKLIENIEAQMSHWREDSNISRFNQTRSTAPMKIPTEMGIVIRHTLQVHQQSRGAYDITAAVAVNLWGFGPIKQRDSIPTDQQIAKAINLIDSTKLKLTSTTDGSFTLKKQNPDMQIDLSSLAKGYAIDKIATLLNTKQCTNYLIEMGGELRAAGTNSKNKIWQVGLEQPGSLKVGHIRRMVNLQNCSIATSGNYRNYFNDPNNSTHYSHIIDPRTGRPISHQLVSVSVIAPSAMNADALATALLVMGPSDGFEFALKNNLSANFVTNTPGGFKEKSTPKFLAE